MPEPWSSEEVEAIVADYFAMLACELRGEDYNKTEHRRRLMRFLAGRSAGSVERKHQNISAILIELGFPYVAGYKPLRNYQQLLFDVVSDRLGVERELDELVGRQVTEPASLPEPADILACLVAPPAGARTTSEPAPDREVTSRGVRVNHLAREWRNASLGVAGERFVVRFEQARLRRAGRERLSESVEHVSQTQGDGLGFDVLSYDETGRERLIEVKTTRYAIETPFYVTDNELRTSQKTADLYHLYRVFEFRETPRLFDLQGPLDEVCTLSPVAFRGTVP